MKLGVALPSFASPAWRPSVDEFIGLARAAESGGFAGLWVADHLLEPPSYNTSWLDPTVTLAAVSRETSTIPLGTSILVLPLRNPVMTANRVASLQYLSNNRVTLGLGMGYFEDEFEAANVPYRDRSSRFTEATDLLYRLLHDKEVTYDGRYYDVKNVAIQPDFSPPRILMAGSGVQRDGERVVPAAVKKRIMRTDGWLAGPWAPAVTEVDWNQIATAAENLDRKSEDITRISMTYTHLVLEASSEQARTEQQALITEFVDESGWRFAGDNYLLGSINDIQEGLHKYAEMGFDEVILGMVVSDFEAAEQQLTLWEENLLSVFH